MCYIIMYGKFHVTSYNSVSSRCWIQLTDGSTKNALNSICNIINFIGIWLPSFEANYDWRCSVHKGKISEIFKRINLNMSELKPDKFNKKYKIS